MKKQPRKASITTTSIRKTISAIVLFPSVITIILFIIISSTAMNTRQVSAYDNAGDRNFYATDYDDCVIFGTMKWWDSSIPPSGAWQEEGIGICVTDCAYGVRSIDYEDTAYYRQLIWLLNGSDNFRHSLSNADYCGYYGGKAWFVDNRVDSKYDDGRLHVLGGQGDDTIFCCEDTLCSDYWDGMDNCQVNGGTGVDEIYGSPKTDYLFGEEDGDLILGMDGDDSISGGDGDDTLFGQADNDNIYGEDGDDTIDGGEDNDYIIGGDGCDDIFGNDGDDELYGDKKRRNLGNCNVLDGGDDNDDCYCGCATGYYCSLTDEDAVLTDCENEYYCNEVPTCD